MKKGTFSILLLTFTLLASFKSVKMEETVVLSKENVKDFITGVFEGVLIEENMDHVLPCIKDAGVIGKDVVEGIQYILKRTKEDEIKGIKLIGQSLTYVPDAMKQCGIVKNSVVKFAGLIASFTNPSSYFIHIGKDLVINGVQIFEEIEDSIKQYKAGNYLNFGKDIGKALAAILIGVSEEMYLVTYQNSTQKESINTASITLQTVELVFKGVLEGIVSNAKIEDIKDCITSSESDLKNIVQAVEDFKKETAFSVLEGLKLLAESIKELPEAMKHCKAGVEDVERLIAMIKNFKSPKAFAFHVGQDIFVNHVQIFDEIKAAIKDYDSSDYEDFGKQIGMALGKIFIGIKQ